MKVNKNNPDYPCLNTTEDIPKKHIKCHVDKNHNTIGQFIIGKSIGEGTFGNVKIGTHILTGEKVTIIY